MNGLLRYAYIIHSTLDIMRTMKSKRIFSIVFILWMGFALVAFFIVQKPDAITIANGLVSLIEMIGLAFLFTLAGTSIGYIIFSRPSWQIEAIPRLLISTGIGMAILGLIGFGLAVVGEAHPIVLLTLLIIIPLIAIANRSLSLAGNDFHQLILDVKDSAQAAPAWIRWFALSAAALTFILALAPPVEAFDALLYHLTVPTWWLRDGGLRLVNMPHYWFPSLVEGMFVWPLAFGKDSVPQLIHFVFALLTILMTWHWTRKLWNPKASWWAIAIFLSMPSLTWLAAWAYTDLVLSFYSLSALYSLWKWKTTSNQRWLIICGAMTGFAMGIKYTSVILPIALFALILLWNRKNILDSIKPASLLAGTGLLIASPWYLRNWIWMSNPFYPFIFGGAYWDAFRANWYSGAGTGIGLNVLSILSLPLATTLGYRDVNYFDGQFGPLFLVLFPLVLWIWWKSRDEESNSRDALMTIIVFSILSILFWTYGVIETSHLWQARLLWPGLIPLIPLMAAGIFELEKLDTNRLRFSFIFSTLTGFMIFVFLLDFGLQVLSRNPLAVAIGIETRENYSVREQPDYTAAVGLVNQTPTDAYIYLIDEPRSYGMNRRVQPDPINDNLPHDFHFYRTNIDLIASWKKLGYTHILISEKAMEADAKSNTGDYFSRLVDLKSLLIKVSQTDNGSYTLYTIPNQ
jgi:hypothetical protein